MDAVIKEYCTAISNEQQKISAEELLWLLDFIVRELKKETKSTTENYSKITNTLKNTSSFILIDPLIINHEIFYLIQNFLIDVLNQWRKYKINEGLLGEIIDLFCNLIEHIKATNEDLSSLFQRWFLNEAFFQTIASVLNDLLVNTERYSNENETMKSLSRLIEAIRYFQRGDDQIRDHPSVLLLVDPVIKSLCSSAYIEILKKSSIKANHLTPFEEFLSRTIPCYCIWNRGKAQFLIINQLCFNQILKSYQEVYELFLPLINDWKSLFTESIFYMTALLRYVAYYPSTREYFKENLKIIDSIMMILNANCLFDNILVTREYNPKTNVTDSAISLIFNLTHDFQFLLLIKQNLFFSKETFLRLKHAKVTRVKLHAFMILAKILDEDDIRKLDHIDALVSVFFGYLSEALDDPSHSFEDVPIEHLLASLKGNLFALRQFCAQSNSLVLIYIAFVQHDQIKEEIARQNYLELLLRCATEEEFHVDLVLQTALDVIWTLAFNQQIRQILIDRYEHFLTYVKTVLIHSSDEGVQAAAKGVLWKLGNQPVLRAQCLNRSDSTLRNEKYDIMISYSHSNKELCHQVHQNLVQSKYRVWLDLENMYGSTFQSMAQGIESSDMILVCMSNPYKQSAYCQCEAEYAYTRRCRIIPLVVENKYRPDGWLGLICASKLYVDFTKSDFEQALQKLIAQIQLHQRQQSLPSTTEHEKKEPLTHGDEAVSAVNVQKNPSEQLERVEHSYTCQYIDRWTHADVLDFLRDKHFDLLQPLFEYEGQFDGHSLSVLYEQCQTNLESTYHLLHSQLQQYHDQSLSYLTFIRFVSELKKVSNQMDLQ